MKGPFVFQQLVFEVDATDQYWSQQCMLYRGDILEGIEISLAALESPLISAVLAKAIADNGQLAGLGVGVSLPGNGQVRLFENVTIPFTTAALDGASVYFSCKQLLPCFLVCDATTRDIGLELLIDTIHVKGFVAFHIRRPVDSPASGKVIA